MQTKNQKIWRAVYTKPRSERKIAERFERQGLEVYCPIQTTMRQWSDRKKKVSVPIFPSYLFLCVTDLQCIVVLQDPGVLNFVYWLGQPAIIRDEEISEIKRFLSNQAIESVVLVDYKRGEGVEIKHGPLKGQVGVIEEIRLREASLNIQSLGMTLRVKLNPALLAKV